MGIYFTNSGKGLDPSPPWPAHARPARSLSMDYLQGAESESQGRSQFEFVEEQYENLCSLPNEKISSIIHPNSDTHRSANRNQLKKSCRQTASLGFFCRCSHLRLTFRCRLWWKLSSSLALAPGRGSEGAAAAYCQWKGRARERAREMRGGRRQPVMRQAVVALVTLLMSVVVADAAVVDVYRMIEYDVRGTPMGSRRAALNHYATSGLDVPGGDLSRAVVILPVLKVNITSLNEFVQNKGLLGGLLLLLPQQSNESGGGDGEDSDENIAKSLAELEQWLVHNTFQYPVYFAYEDDNVKDILLKVTANDAAGRPATVTTGGYKLVVTARNAKKISTSTITNIQGWLPGLRAEGDNSMLPTIAIVASYDTFGAAPELAVGSDSNGSGVAMLLELARLFSRLYANSKTRGPYNLLFGLTSGGPYNYNGTHNWLRNFDQRLRESMEYAVCLNTLGSSSERMWLHVSKPPESSFIKQMHSEFENVAEGLGLTVQLKHKKINISNSRVAWEHEQFSRQRITAATLSQLEEAPELLERTGGIADSRRAVNETVVLRNIKLVAESLARRIYGHQGTQQEFFAAGSDVALDPAYVRSWLDLLGRTPRVAPLIGKNAPIITALHKDLAQHTKDASLQHDTLDSTFVFYDTTKAQLNVHQVASVTFDFIAALVVGLYLVLLYVALSIFTKGVDDFRGVPRKVPSRKSKSN